MNTTHQQVVVVHVRIYMTSGYGKMFKCTSNQQILCDTNQFIYVYCMIARKFKVYLHNDSKMQ